MAETISSAALLSAELARVLQQQYNELMSQQVVPVGLTQLEEIRNTAAQQAQLQRNATQQYSAQVLYGHQINRPEWIALNSHVQLSDWSNTYEAHKRAEELAETLLRENLSEQQQVEYASDKSFRVIGSDSGKTYRINYGTSVNIDELAAGGRVAQRWCFQPQDAPSVGDTMLTQKIALENYERQALKRANRFPIDSYLARPAFFGGMYQELAAVAREAFQAREFYRGTEFNMVWMDECVEVRPSPLGEYMPQEAIRTVPRQPQVQIEVDSASWTGRDSR